MTFFIPDTKGTIRKCKRKQFELPRNYSWSNPRVCTQGFQNSMTEQETLLEFFLLGGGNLRRSDIDIDHSNLF